MSAPDAPQWDPNLFRETNARLKHAENGVAGTGLMDRVQQTMRESNTWGLDKQIEADYLIALDRAEKSGDLAGGLERDHLYELQIQSLAPELHAVLTKEYGGGWQYKAPKEVLKSAWSVAKELEKKEEHGRRLKQEMRTFWDQPQYNERGERMYLPEQKGKRREWLGRAKYFDQARVESRVAMARAVNAIAAAKGYDIDDREYRDMRMELISAWGSEAASRERNSVYQQTADGVGLKDARVKERMRQGDIPEIGLVAEKAWEASGLTGQVGGDTEEQRTALLDKIGIVAGGDGLTLKEEGSGARTLLTGRMLREELGGMTATAWQESGEGAQDADILFMNMLGLESTMKMEVAGREIILGEIYHQKAEYLSERGMAEMSARETELPELVKGIRGTKDLWQAYWQTLRDLNDILYLNFAALVNKVKGEAIRAGGHKRQWGEKMADWIGRMGLLGSNVNEWLMAKMNGDNYYPEANLSGRLSFNMNQREERDAAT